MKNEKNLSVVLPCYNVEDFIADCLDSLLNQDIPQSDYEIICVDDCGKDNTKQIIKEYQTRYDNITLVEHEINKSAPAARNTAISQCNGKYVWFVDPDDMIERDCLKYLLAKCDEGELDILLFNNKIVNEKGNFIQSEILVPYSHSVVSGQEYLIEYFDGKLINVSVAWRGIYRTKLLSENHIQFPIIRSGDDSIFIWRAMIKGNRVCSVDKTPYLYRVNQNSLTSDKNKIKIPFLYAKGISFPNEIVSVINDYQIDIKNKINENLIQTIKFHNTDFVNKILGLKSKYLKEIYSKLKGDTNTLKALYPYLNRKSQILYQKNRFFFIWYFKLKYLQVIK